MRPRLIAILIFLLILPLPSRPVLAQESQPDGPVYVVKNGDSLWDIAARFGVSLEELQAVNHISDAGQLVAGFQLLIPGLEGFQGVVDTLNVPYGETLLSMSRRYQVPMETLMRLNRLANPAAVYAGFSLILPADRMNPVANERAMMRQGQTLLEFAALNNRSPWEIVQLNGLPGMWGALPGDVLLFSGGEQQPGPGALPEVVTALTVSPLIQGKTTVISISGQAGIQLNGTLAGRELRFFTSGNDYVALQGIHAMIEPGFYSLNLRGVFTEGGSYGKAVFEFSQPVHIRSGNYLFDPPLNVDPQTIDPAVTEPEDRQWAELGSTFTPDKMWDGAFQSPVPLEFKDCWPSLFGSRRSFNGSPYTYFHSGLDFCGGVETQLFAAAAGKVIFTGRLTVRGNATVIDHGWGVYTAYDHQSKILVKPGDLVEPGQVIGLGGATGRVTGPHLHWEVWVGGVQVDPRDWLENVFP
jgi:murein DD-endopeptidase MepM/ murein hydrolase activator NlpD